MSLLEKVFVMILPFFLTNNHHSIIKIQRDFISTKPTIGTIFVQSVSTPKKVLKNDIFPADSYL